MTKSKNAIGFSSLGPRLLVPILLTLIIGLALSIGAFFFGRNLEYYKTKANFQQTARLRAAHLAEGIESKLHTLTAISSFYAASKEVDRLEFRTFVEPFLSIHPGIQALEWVPRIPDDQRALYEKAAQQDGLPDFQINERKSQGVMERAEEREEYFPVYFVEPLKGNEASVGFDLASNPTRLEALNRSRDTSKMLSTARITLVQETGKQFGFLVFQPVYAQGVSLETVRDRRERLKGFALGVFRIDDIMKSSLDHLGLTDIDMRLYDLDAPEGKRFLHAYHSHQASEVSHQISKKVEDSTGLQYVKTIDVAGRTWKILCQATPAFVSSGKTWLPWGVLAGGLLITFLLTFHLLSLTKRNILISKAYRELEAEIGERKQAEEALKQNRDQFESILSNIECITYRCALDKDWTMIYMSSHVDQLTGYPPSDFINNAVRTYETIIHREDAEYVDQSVNEAIESGKPWEVEYRIRHKDGGLRWVYEKGGGVIGTDGKVEYLDGFMINITERKRLEAEMERTATELTQLIDTANAPIFGVDKDGKINEWNEMVARITGYSKDEVMGQDLVEQYITDEYKAPVKQVLDNALKGIETENYELPLFTKDGRRAIVLFNATTRRDVKGDIIGVIGIGQDVTKYKRTEKDLHESEEKYRTVFEASSDAIMLLDDNGFIDCNDQALKMFGLTNKEEFIGIHPSELSPPNQPDGEDSLIAENNKITEAFKDGYSKFDWVHRRKTGEEFTANVLLTSIELNGEPVLHAVVRDISDLVVYQNELEGVIEERTAELNKALSAAKQAREELLESERELTIRNKIADIFLTSSENDMYGDVLDVILEIMASKYGFFGYINEDGDMVAPSMTKDIMDECQIPDKDIIFSRRDWNPDAMWGKTLLKKKTLYANKELHLRKGHVPLTRALTVPILYQEELVGILGVADKETDYDEKDREVLEVIAAHIAPILSVLLQRNVQERHRWEAEKHLQESLVDTELARDRIDGILKSVADGLIVTDVYNRVILMNRAAEDLLGVHFSEVIDQPIDFAIDDPILRDKVKETLNKKTTGYLFDFELPSDNPKHPRIMRARTSVIHDREGKDSGIVTIIHDVTHEREVDRIKTEFISTAAHELRTPLTSIQGFSEILLMRENLKPEEREKFLTYINKQSVGLAAIINDLLDISRIESGRGFALNKVPCNAGDAIKEILPYFQEQYENHQFEVALPEKPVQLHVDKEKMGQVLKNLLSNAVKYSPEGGLIRVVGKVVDFGIGNLDFGSEETQQSAMRDPKSKMGFRISVQDQGMGMTPDQVDKVFDKFYRVDASNTAIEGTGLGMTVVQHIVEAHGGKVWVESELGKGTTVTFTIPT